MNNSIKIGKLFAVAESLLAASVVVQQSNVAASMDALVIASGDLFSVLPISELTDKADQSGFEQAGDIIACLYAAQAAFIQGNTQAIRVSTSPLCNDPSGNDHIKVTMSFTAGDQQVVWATSLVEIIDNNEVSTEISNANGAHIFLFNGNAASPELYAFLKEELEGAADAYIMQNLVFPYYDSTAEIAAAQALIDQHQALIDTMTE